MEDHGEGLRNRSSIATVASTISTRAKAVAAKKIFFFVNVYKPAKHSGGPIYSVSRMAEALQECGFSVEVWTTRLFQDDSCPDQQVINGVKVHYARFKPNILARTGISYLKTSVSVDLEDSFWDQMKSELPHCDYAVIRNTYFPNANRLSKLLKRNGVGYAYYSAGEISWARVRFRFLKKIIYLLLFEKRVIDAADRLMCFTTTEKQDYKWLSRNRKFTMVPNGVDSTSNHSVIVPSPELKRTYSASEFRRRFLFFGRIHPTKGPDISIEALKLVHKSFPDAVLYIAGAQQNRSFQQQMEERIAALGLQNYVNFVGCLAGDDKLYALRNSCALVAPTVAEGFSISILEALNEGLPVITTEGARFPEIAEHGCGFVVARSAPAFAKAMADIAQLDSAGWKLLSSAAKKLISQNYRWDHLVDRFAREVLSGK